MGEGDGFGGETGYGGSDSFGDSSGFSGSEGANLGGDFSGTTFGSDFGGLGDGGLTGFGDLSSMLSDPLAMEGLLGNFGFSDMGDSLGNFGYGQNDLGSLFSENNNPLSELFQGKLGKGIMALLGMADKTGMIGQMGKMGSLATNPDQGKGWGSLAGSMLGSMFAGPLGGIAGGQLGGMMGQGAFSGLNNAGTGGASTSATGNGGVGGMLEGLGGMYAAYQGQKGAGNMLGSLQSLYSQDSPYAQAMRQNLQRRDAAGGRRSQYGPREVELQAKLAQMASSQIPAMSQLQQRQNINRAIMMQQGLGAFNKMGGIRGLQDLLSPGWGGMFDQGAYSALGSQDFGLGNIFDQSGATLGGGLDQSWIPDYGDPFGGP